MEWISVKDRLPEKANPQFKDYLLSDTVLLHVTYDEKGENYHTTTGYYHYNNKRFEEIRGEWAEQEVGTTVTHWMPLPKPPKE